MKVYQYAKANDLTVKEVKELFNLPSHMSLVPESCDELPEVVVEIASKQEVPVKKSQHDSNGVADISYHSHPPVKAIVEIVKEAVEDVKDVLDEADVDLELIANSLRGAGTKSPYWNLRHLIGRD